MTRNIIDATPMIVTSLAIQKSTEIGVLFAKSLSHLGALLFFSVIDSIKSDVLNQTGYPNFRTEYVKAMIQNIIIPALDNISSLIESPYIPVTTFAISRELNSHCHTIINHMKQIRLPVE
jgi:hypothetical protein